MFSVDPVASVIVADHLPCPLKYQHFYQTTRQQTAKPSSNNHSHCQKNLKSKPLNASVDCSRNTVFKKLLLHLTQDWNIRSPHILFMQNMMKWAFYTMCIIITSFPDDSSVTVTNPNLIHFKWYLYCIWTYK